MVRFPGKLSICVALALGALALCGCPPEPRAELNGHGYDLVHVPDGITWEDAEEEAASMFVGRPRKYGYLACITSQEEHDWVVAQFLASGDVGHVLIGGYQTPDSPCPSCNWNWVTGEVWSFEGFVGMEPDDADLIEDDDENYAAMERTTDTWYDTGNEFWQPGVPHHYYLVEYE